MIRFAPIIVIVVAFSQGCRSPDPTIELLESELRWYEDNLYMLDDQLDRCCEQLLSAQRYNAALRAQLAEAARTPSKKVNSGVGTDLQDDQGFDQVSEEDLLRGLGVPVIEPGAASSQLDESSPPDSEEPPGVELQGIPEPSDVDSQPNAEDSSRDPFQDARQPGGTRVTKIKLNRRLTGGYDFDGKPGSDGLMVVIEPVDRQDNYLAQAGYVTLEVRDGQHDGIHGQLAQWRFDVSEAEQHLKDTLMGRGMHFQLPWPNGPPKTPRVELVVHYETPDGKVLRADKQVEIDTSKDAAATKDGTPRLMPWQPHR